ncbi:MAG: hypothetical protein QG637_1389 [Chloroflexota bacterium]|nr:hypothetical protein [Chloroflexota bacterium]
MIRDDSAKQLHDRATRGDELLDEEQKQLESWYASQDLLERKTLRLAAREKTVAALPSQVDAILAQLTSGTKRIQEVAVENEVLRREIAALRRQLVNVLEAQPA